MEGIKALSTGTKLVLAAGPLLFFSLFFTWQTPEIDYGRAGRADALLDGWDFWGLLIGLVTMTLVTLVVIAELTEVEMSEDVPWVLLNLALGVVVFMLALVKNLTDSDSAWASYAGVLLAAVVALGCYEMWAETSDRPSVLGRFRRGISSTA